MNAMEQQLADGQPRLVAREFMKVKFNVRILTIAEMMDIVDKTDESNIKTMAKTMATMFLDPVTGQPAFSEEFIRDQLTFETLGQLIAIWREANKPSIIPSKD